MITSFECGESLSSPEPLQHSLAEILDTQSEVLVSISWHLFFEQSDAERTADQAKHLFGYQYASIREGYAPQSCLKHSCLGLRFACMIRKQTNESQFEE